MGLTARDKGGSDFELIPEDLHFAICYGIWDLGHPKKEAGGQRRKGLANCLGEASNG